MDLADDLLILAEYGSRAYGTATASSDHDLMGIYVESDAQIYGLEVAQTRQTAHGRRSTAHDTDVTLHPLRKYVSLAASGNPTMLSLLWSPEHLIKKTSPAATLLIANRELFVTRRAITAHIGYAASQRRALTGERAKRTNRPELVAEHGYDTKFAMHLLRLLIQGIELAENGAYTLPMEPAALGLLRDVRAGRVALERVLEHADALTEELQRLATTVSLPERPGPAVVNELLLRVRQLAVSLPL